MRTIFICLLSVLVFCGCKESSNSPTAQEHLTPRGREREVLRVHGLNPDSERGQDKLRKMRERQAKLDSARERMDKWAEDAARREAEKAQE